MKTAKSIAGLLLAAGIGLLAGCSSSPTGQGYGELKLNLIDSPADYQQVNIVVSHVDAHINGADSLNGWVTVNSTRTTYNLLQLINGANAILGDVKLPAGKYTQLRLVFDTGSTIMVGGVTFPLQVSSSLQSGLKLNNNFDITAGQLYELTLDFNAAQSINLTGGNQYKLNPVIRVEANVISGTISGTIIPALARAVVSTFDGTDSVITYADTSTGEFQLVALPAGAYAINITARDTLYADTTINVLALAAQQNISLGTVTLRNR